MWLQLKRSLTWTKEGWEKAAREVDGDNRDLGTPPSGAFLILSFTTDQDEQSILKWCTCLCWDCSCRCIYWATALPESDPENRVYPAVSYMVEAMSSRRFRKQVKLEAFGYGTDCYPRQHIESWLLLRKSMMLFSSTLAMPTRIMGWLNSSNKTIYTYMGCLSQVGRISYSTSGQLSPLINDPLLSNYWCRHVYFFLGGYRYVAWHGTAQPSVSWGEQGTLGWSRYPGSHRRPQTDEP